MGFRLSTGVVEHIPDLGREVRDDGRIEECVESCENHTADNHADDDLDTGVDIAFARLGGKGGLGGDGDGVYLVTNGIEELFHVILPFNLSVFELLVI